MIQKRLLTLAMAGIAGAALVAPAIASAAATGKAVYDALPAKGTVSVPSYGPEAYSFNQFGNEVILRPHSKAIRNVKVTMVSYACQQGSWNDSCVTTPGATFKAPITLNLYRYSHTNAKTGIVKPGKRILRVTRTFRIHYRPSSTSAGEPRYMGSDGQLHNGLGQTITFPVHHKLGNDIVWTVSYDTNTSGPSPLGQSGPMDSLNVGVTPTATIGHDRFPGTIFWDTRYAGFSGGAPFVTGQLNRDNGWTGSVPAASFIQ